MEKEKTDDLKEEIKNEVVLNKNGIKIKLKTEKKSNKKLAKAINVLKFHESGESKKEIFSIEPTNRLWIYHFGNGDEDDQKSIKEYFQNNFGNSKVYIFPGISYGFIELENIDASLISSNNLIDRKYPYANYTIKFATGERKIFVFYSSVLLKDVQENNTSTFPIANYEVSIPGLYVIDDFISPEEEQVLLENIDKKEWTKLSNRKVQHYGYEFIYGANNVNKNNKVGELPDFEINLKTSNFSFNFRI